jgi:hypothetical protein
MALSSRNSFSHRKFLLEFIKKTTSKAPQQYLLRGIFIYNQEVETRIPCIMHLDFLYIT